MTDTWEELGDTRWPAEAVVHRSWIADSFAVKVTLKTDPPIEGSARRGKFRTTNATIDAAKINCLLNYITYRDGVIDQLREENTRLLRALYDPELAAKFFAEDLGLTQSTPRNSN